MASATKISTGTRNASNEEKYTSVALAKQSKV